MSHAYSSSHALLVLLLLQAAALGLNTVRVWAHTSNPNMTFQISPGEYNPAAFQTLDFILLTASELKLKVILSLVDNW
jgi:mannan endo-1,4-beta-mannosidase